MKDKLPFFIVLGLEILVVVLASIGLIPREAVLMMTGIMIFYFIFSKIEDSLILFILSIPLFVALPISESFDTMANWRILLAVLFLVWFFKKRDFKLRIKANLLKFTLLFIFIAVLSLVFAQNKIIGIKEILFLVNIFLLFPIIQDIGKDANQRKRIIIASMIAVIIALSVGYSQIIFTITKPLYVFWQFWANKVISVFYGADLSKLLSVSNTWFSYYPDSPPTLRMFSVFPDSHSFALFIIIGLVFLTYLLKKKKFYWIAIVLSFFALMFSGSRAIWLSALPVFLIAVFLLIFKKQKIFQSFVIMLIIFVLAFPLSSLVLSKTRQDGEDATLAFKRAKSITDLEELSIQSRLGIWKTSLRSILKYPVLGVGIGNYPLVLGEDISTGKQGASAHNLYLNIAAEMGLLGLVALLLIFFEILKTCWKKFKIDNYTLIFLFFFVWILIYNLFDVVLLNDKVLLLFMVALGLLYVYGEESIGEHSDI